MTAVFTLHTDDKLDIELNGDDPMGKRTLTGGTRPEPFCGDYITNNEEVCDGDYKNCTEISASYTSGMAYCNSDCTGFDESGCE